MYPFKELKGRIGLPGVPMLLLPSPFPRVTLSQRCLDSLYHFVSLVVGHAEFKYTDTETCVVGSDDLPGKELQPVDHTSFVSYSMNKIKKKKR